VPSRGGIFDAFSGPGYLLCPNIVAVFFLFYDLHQITAISILRHRCGNLLQLFAVDVAQAVGDFFHTGNSDTLPILDGLNEAGRLLKGLVSTRIQPGKTASDQLNFQQTAFQVIHVDIRDLKLPAFRRFELLGDLDHVIIINIESGYGIALAEDTPALFDGHGIFQDRAQVVSLEYIVSEDETDVVGTDEFFADDKGLGQPFRSRLFTI